MRHFNFKFLRAVGTMVGSIVGVGVFGLPYAFAQSGFPLGLILITLMAGLLICLQLMYAEVAIQTPGVKERMAGYVRRYIGKRWATFSMVALFAALTGSMLAYIVVGGRFLYLLFSPLLGGGEVVYSLLIAGLASFFIFKGLQFVARAEVVILSILLFLFAFIGLAAVPHMSLSNVLAVNWDQAFVPYGVILFAMAGLGAVPEMETVLGERQNRKLPKAILAAMGIIFLLYTWFSFTVVGVTGAETTSSAFEGLVPTLGPLFAVVASALGALTIFSIYTLIGISLRNTLQYDYKISKKWACLLVCGMPVVLFLLGFREFIEIAGFVGAVLGGTLGILIVWTYERMRRSEVCKEHRCLEVPPLISWLVIAVFATGIIAQIISYFR